MRRRTIRSRGRHSAMDPMGGDPMAHRRRLRGRNRPVRRGHDAAERSRRPPAPCGATVFTGAREGIMITDRTGTILEVNDAFSPHHGIHARRGARAKSALAQVGPSKQRVLRENVEIAWTGKVTGRGNSGTAPKAETFTRRRSPSMQSATPAAKWSSMWGCSRDITEIKEHEQQLEHITRYDALTGLPNRALVRRSAAPGYGACAPEEGTAGRRLF